MGYTEDDLKAGDRRARKTAKRLEAELARRRENAERIAAQRALDRKHRQAKIEAAKVRAADAQQRIMSADARLRELDRKAARTTGELSPRIVEQIVQATLRHHKRELAAAQADSAELEAAALHAALSGGASTSSGTSYCCNDVRSAGCSAGSHRQSNRAESVPSGGSAYLCDELSRRFTVAWTSLGESTVDWRPPMVGCSVTL